MSTKDEIVAAIRSATLTKNDLYAVYDALLEKKRLVLAPETAALNALVGKLDVGMKIAFGNKRNNDHRYGYHEAVVEGIGRTRLDVIVDGQIWNIHARIITHVADETGKLIPVR